MPEMTIRLRVNPETGKKDIVIDLRSDDDALPHEHEQQHRRLVEKLISGGLVEQAEVGKVVIERESVDSASSTQTAPLSQPGEQTPTRQSEQEGQSS